SLRGSPGRTRRRAGARARSAPRSGSRSPRGSHRGFSCSLKRQARTDHSSGIAEFVETVLVEPEVVGELVQDGDPDLLLELPLVGERLDEGLAEDADPVGQGAGPV